MARDKKKEINMNKINGIMAGALAGTLLASTYMLLGKRPALIKKLKNHSQEWVDKAKNIKKNLYDDLYDLAESKRSRSRKTFVGGALLGLFIGASSAALLTPKSGRQLRKELNTHYQDVADKTHDILHYINKNGYRRPLNQLKRGLTSSKRKATHKTTRA
jgi:gas vesicle protein